MAKTATSRKRSSARPGTPPLAPGDRELLEAVRDTKAKILADRADREADVERVLEELRREESLLPGMAIAEAGLRRRLREKGATANRQDLVAFLAEDDDAILSPTVLALLRDIRKKIRRYRTGSPEQKEIADRLQRSLRQFLNAYASPRTPKAAIAATKAGRLLEARLKALLEAHAKGSKLGLAFERQAAALGVTRPRPDDKGDRISRAAARADQRARKRAGDPPRPRGRRPSTS